MGDKLEIHSILTQVAAQEDFTACQQMLQVCLIKTDSEMWTAL